MVVSDLLQGIFRWLHVIAGILWIGHLYFFNFVNGPFAATMDGETKKKVVPELMPRALFWFRWGAAWTWITGILLLNLVFYHGGAMFEGESQVWTPVMGLLVAFSLLGAAFYDVVARNVKKNEVLAAVGFFAVVAYFILATENGFSYRSALIHVGVLFGTTMAYNVWMRIWPMQRRIITAIKGGQAPDPAWVAMAGGRSKHNTYMSVPLLYVMLNQHMTGLAGWGPLAFAAVVALGWAGVYCLYKKSAQVKGF